MTRNFKEELRKLYVELYQACKIVPPETIKEKEEILIKVRVMANQLTLALQEEQEEEE